MAKVILQPCANDLAFDHFEHTVGKTVPIQSISMFLGPKQLDQLKMIYPDGECYVWGVEPKKGGNIKQWEKISPGDIAFFARHKQIFASGSVTMKLHNRPLALYLWNQNGEGSTWEYIYFLKEIKVLTTPVELFNQAVRYMANKSVQGFSVLDAERSELALEFFEIPATSEDEVDSNNRQEIRKRLLALPNTDLDVQTKGRREQWLFQKWINGNKKLNTCGICLKEYPVEFITAAHIKKRSECSYEERTNLNIVMPMCRMGCDQLYEIGYISVSHGKVISLHKMTTSAAVDGYLKNIVGNQCPYYTEETIQFFEAHIKFHSPKTR